MKILNLYPNCSLGGISTVYVNRVINNPQIQFDFIFTKDLRGKRRYNNLHNANVRIIPDQNLEKYLEYILKFNKYEIITICQFPNLIPLFNSLAPQSKIFYEIHTSLSYAIINDITIINKYKLDAIFCPSQWLKDYITNVLCLPVNHPIHIIDNILTDYTKFPSSDMQFSLSRRKGQIPLLWIGRAYSSGPKNYHDFLQILASLPSNYFGIIVLSFETEPDRLAKLLSMAAQYNLTERLEIFMDIETEDMKNLYNAIKIKGGIACSTSLNESFGYFVREAAQLGLPAVSYKAGPLATFNDPNFYPVEIGDIEDCVNKILALTS